MQLLLPLILSLLFLTACHQPTADQALRLTRCADCPVGRAAAALCVYGDKAYLFGGRDEQGHYQADYWIYDPATDQWSGPFASPIKPRVNALAVATSDGIYLGLGFCGQIYADSSYLRDWWQLHPEDGSWQQLSDMSEQSHYTVGPVGLVDTTGIYALCASGEYSNNEIRRFLPAENRWEYRYTSRSVPVNGHGTSGAGFDGKIYLGAGFNTTSQAHRARWASYCPATNQWANLPDVPGGPRCLAAATAEAPYIYLIGGRRWANHLSEGALHEDIVRYDTEKGRWTLVGQLEDGGLENHIAFTWHGYIYFGLGENTQGITKHLYRIEQ